MFRQRAIISLTLGPLALLIIYFGGWPYFLIVLLLMLLAMQEYVNMLRQLGWFLSLPVLLTAVLLQMISARWLPFGWAELTLAFNLLMVLSVVLWQYERRNLEKAAASLLAMGFGVLLVGWFGSHFLRLRALPELGFQWTIVAMVGTWAADVGAYLIGRFLAGNLLGRHHFSARLSPKKTVEGFVGGILFGLMFTIGVGLALDIAILPLSIFALVVSFVSPIGDLGVSLLKREAGVKDSGQIFPGHGGVLDRVDTLLWTVTFAYFIALLS